MASGAVPALDFKAHAIAVVKGFLGFGSPGVQHGVCEVVLTELVGEAQSGSDLIDAVGIDVRYFHGARPMVTD